VRAASPPPRVSRQLAKALGKLAETVQANGPDAPELDDQLVDVDRDQLLDRDAFACAATGLPDLAPWARFSVATGPDPAAIRLLHRDGASWIHFSVRRGDNLERLAAVQVSDLDTMFPAVRDHLVRDAYVSIQGMHRPGRGQSRLIPELPSSQFTKKTTSAINAVFADLDFPAKGLDFWRDVLPAVGVLVHRRILPPYSVVADSGHGAWLFWILRSEDDPTKPVKADWNTRAAHYLLQQAVTKRLVDLGVDTAAIDLARSTRVPGSQNTKTGREVRWNVSAEGGRVLSYTMRELADALGVNLRLVEATPAIPAPVLRLRKPVDPALTARGQAGWRAVWTFILADLERLSQLRGGFQKGTRNNAALATAICLKKLKTSDPEIMARLLELGSRCRPPLLESELRDAIASAKKSGPLRAGRPLGLKYETLAIRLAITLAEAELLEHLPAAHAAPEPTRADRVQERRVAILRACRDAGVALSVTALCGLLRDAGKPASRRTVWLDLQALAPDLTALGLKLVKKPPRPTNPQMALPVA
jgi:hypothetical protein